MPEVSLIDKSFNPDSSTVYSIAVQANPGGLSFCVTDQETNNFIAFRKYKFEQVVLLGDLVRKIDEILRKDEILALRFQKTKFLAYTRQTTLVPETFFSVTSSKEYLQFNTAGNIDPSLFNNKIHQYNLYNVFALPDELVSLVTLHFRKAEFMNQTTPFLRHVAFESASSEEPLVFLGLNPEFFDIACVLNGQLKLYNTFQYTTESDLLYYILFVCKQVDFDINNLSLRLSGDLSHKTDYYEIIRQYISNTRFDTSPCSLKLSAGLRILDVSRFMNLLNLNSCELSEENSGDAI